MQNRSKPERTVVFNVGDTVIHPGYGVSKVEEIQNDAKGRIYILKPKKSAPGNFRILISERITRKLPSAITTMCNFRSGIRYILSYTVKNESGNAHSSTRESLLESARKVLVEEIAYVSGIPKDEVEEWIDNVLRKKRERPKVKREDFRAYWQCLCYGKYNRVY